MAEERKVDKLILSDSSLAGRLKKRRQAIEDGDPSGGQHSDVNSPENVLPRGYFLEEGDKPKLK